MSKKPQKPLMLAYIVFLFITSLYYLVSIIFDLEFQTWSKIIAAATIASYSFSISSIFKTLLKQNHSHHKLLNQYSNLIKTTIQKTKSLIPAGEKLDSVLESGGSLLNHTSEYIAKIDKQSKRNERLSFYFDALGYLLFFCILGFEAVYKLFCPMLDYFTLLAFLIIVVIEYIESVIFIKYEDLFNDLIDSVKNTIKLIEEKENGQTENAQSEQG